jgi:hypothetical protein
MRPALLGRIDVGGDYTYRGSMQLDAANGYAKFIIDKTVWDGVINMHASWTKIDDRWSLLLWGKTVRNIDYTSQSNDQAGFFETSAEFSKFQQSPLYISSEPSGNLRNHSAGKALNA